MVVLLLNFVIRVLLLFVYFEMFVRMIVVFVVRILVLCSGCNRVIDLVV